MILPDLDSEDDGELENKEVIIDESENSLSNE